MDKQVGALIAAALYKSRLFEGEPSIDEGTFDSCQKAARWRIEYLSLLRDRKLSIASVSDLAWASTVIDVMACRVLSQAGADYVQDKYPLCWYESYCGSVLQFSMAMQQAVQDGRLILRDHLSRVPLRGDDLAYWRDADLTYVSNCGPLVPDCAGWDGDPTYWPDGLVTPPGAITVQEAEQWATGAGLTEPGELPRLLGLSLPEEAASGGDDQAAPAGGNQFSPERLWERYQALRGDGKGKFMRRLAAESGISDREIRRLIKPFRPSPFGGLGASRASQGTKARR